MDLTSWAHDLARSLLAEPLPRRWVHSQGVAAKAHTLAPILGDDADLLQAAAVLHDIGYAPPIATTGFHPLDGARYLRDETSADQALVRLVANHSCALLEAEERGLRHELQSEFPLLDRPDLMDALIYCDMTTTPNGQLTGAPQRLAEIRSRYGGDSVVGRFIRRAAPDLLTAVRSVERRIAAAA
ncbi:HD domain-containing protein [Streptomyces sp. NBC_01537]|uniref:HD domain-containing protein n=1 Tax=Streptomyces sp. NBC_01537 TaxID=2903896 RepID=UPI003867CA9A